MKQPPAGRSSPWVALLQVLLAVLKALLGRKGPGGAARGGPAVPKSSGSRKPAVPRRTPAASSAEDGGIGRLFRDRQGDAIVTASGVVVKVLRDDLDDTDGSGMHQQFLVEVGEVTVKISHNLKFGRAPVEEGDIIRFKGEYEWNDRGGCVHWTHHDPKGWHEDGWLEHAGKQYG